MVPHGQSVSLTAPEAFRFSFDSAPERHLRAAALLDPGAEQRDDPSEQLPVGARSALMRDIGIPNGIGGVGYTEADVPDLVPGHDEAAAPARHLPEDPHRGRHRRHPHAVGRELVTADRDPPDLTAAPALAARRGRRRFDTARRRPLHCRPTRPTTGACRSAWSSADGTTTRSRRRSWSARETGVPCPRGAGTSIAGQAVNTAVVAGLHRHLRRGLAIDPRRGRRARAAGRRARRAARRRPPARPARSAPTRRRTTAARSAG